MNITIKKIRKDIKKKLKSVENYNFDFLKYKVENILLQYYNSGQIYNFHIICNSSNNNIFYIEQNLIKIDIHLQTVKTEKSFEQILFTIILKKEPLTHLRKRKLKKLYDIH